MALCLLAAATGCGRRETLVQVARPRRHAPHRQRRGAGRLGPAGRNRRARARHHDHTVRGPGGPRLQGLFARCQGWPNAGTFRPMEKSTPSTSARTPAGPMASRSRRAISWNPIAAFSRPALAASILHALPGDERGSLQQRKNHQLSTRSGFKALDDYTFVVSLAAPTPYLLAMMVHNSWYPVPISTIKKYGSPRRPDNQWTRPGTSRWQRPVLLKEWKINSHILVVEKSRIYWDAQSRPPEMAFISIPMGNEDTAERMFRSGQLHTQLTAPPSKVAFYRKYKPDQINDLSPALHLLLPLQRHAPAAQRQARAPGPGHVHRPPGHLRRRRSRGRKAGILFDPPGTGGFTAKAQLKEDLAAARKLLAEAGYPDGKNFPPSNSSSTPSQSHKAIAEAIQQCGRRTSTSTSACTTRNGRSIWIPPSIDYSIAPRRLGLAITTIPARFWN